MKFGNSYWLYQIECLPNQKRYIGLTGKPNPCWRWSEHFSNLRGGISTSRLLQEEWLKHPDWSLWSFRTLCCVEGLRTARYREAEYFLQTPESLRLNCPSNLALSYMKHEKVKEMLRAKKLYRDITKETGLSPGLISRLKQKMEFESLSNETT